MALDPLDLARVTRALGQAPTELLPADAHFNQAARRLRARLSDGTTAFVKIADAEGTHDWLRREHQVYDCLAGADFLPDPLGWDDDGEVPVLVLEDLTGLRQPPAWRWGDVEAVVATLAEVANAPIPPDTPDVEDLLGTELRAGWPDVAADPGPFLTLGIAGAGWLERCLEDLAAAALSAPLVGDSLLHFDVRSDNLFIAQGRAMLIDWNWACRGNAGLDLALWLPSLHAESGPPPEDLLADDHGWASLIAGYFASHAGRPNIEQAPGVRELQTQQLRTALPWAARSLGLPPPS